MVCIEKRPHITGGRSSALHFRYLTWLLDRGHINFPTAPHIYISYFILFLTCPPFYFPETRNNILIRLLQTAGRLSP